MVIENVWPFYKTIQGFTFQGDPLLGCMKDNCLTKISVRTQAWEADPPVSQADRIKDFPLRGCSHITSAAGGGGGGTANADNC